MVDLKKQYLKIKTEVDEGIAKVISSGAFINGQAVKDFTRDMSGYLGVKHTIPCGNGTDALQIALMALNLKPGDEVITVAFTFVSTAEVIALLGLKPVFVDIDPLTFTMDPDKLTAAITNKTKCIIPVHLYGQSCNMEAIMAVAKKYNLAVVEDNAQAIGCNYTFSNGITQKAGTIGHIGCTSFYPSKNLGAYGDGGALFTNDDELAENVKMIANHGQQQKYAYNKIGVNSRLDSIQAVVLKAKLKQLDDYINSRQKAADFYDRAFAKHPKITIPHRATYSSHVFHQYTLVVDADRDALKQTLSEKGIPSMIYYPNPLHLEKAYENCGYKQGDLPCTEAAAKQVISLPMHTELDDSQLQYIVDGVLSLL